LVERVEVHGRPVAHVAREMGVSRQCAHRWVSRYRAHGVAGLEDRSSRPRSSPGQTPPAKEAEVIAARTQARVGPDELARRTGVPARTVSRILRRAGLPYLWQLDPVTGERIRASKTTARRYEKAHPGDLVHVDVKKLGRLHPGGGWKAHGRAMGSTGAKKRARIGYDYIHSAIDDHSRVAYSEILSDEKGATCAAFIARSLAWFATQDVIVKAVITDNHWSYKHSADVARELTAAGAEHWYIKAHCPWQNGKVERFNRTLAAEWAYARAYESNENRADAFPQWLAHYNNERHHYAVGAAPITRLSPT
jgi:transposase InsO family protein